MARPKLPARPILRSQHFSDSDSSSNDELGGGGMDGTEDDSDDSDTGPRPAPPDLGDTVRAGRRIRRSWGIPSLISRQGSKSNNLGIDTGIARAHELIR